MLRGITFVFALLTFLIPAGFAFVHGHGRNGYDGWVDTMYLNTPLGIIAWLLWAIWFFKPLAEISAYYMKGN